MTEALVALGKAARNLWFQIVLWLKFTWAALRVPRSDGAEY